MLHEDLEEYIRQGEPARSERSKAWQMAIGLQKVDGLDTSSYLNETAKLHIEGEITIDEAKKRIDSYYQSRIARKEDADLRNRTLHVAWKPEKEFQSANTEVSKCQIGSLNCTLEEIAVLQVIKEKPNITQKELAIRTGKSERTIKRLTVALTERGIMARRNGKRNGYWEIL